MIRSHALSVVAFMANKHPFWNWAIVNLVRVAMCASVFITYRHRAISVRHVRPNPSPTAFRLANIFPKPNARGLPDKTLSWFVTARSTTKTSVFRLSWTARKYLGASLACMGLPEAGAMLTRTFGRTAAINIFPTARTPKRLAAGRAGDVNSFMGHAANSGAVNTPLPYCARRNKRKVFSAMLAGFENAWYFSSSQGVNLRRQVSFWSGSFVATNNVRAACILPR